MKHRNQVYKLFEMAPGDIFYFSGDRNKKLFRLYDEKPFEKKLQAGFWKEYANCRPLQCDAGKPQVEKHLAKRFVTFLRNVNYSFLNQ